MTEGELIARAAKAKAILENEIYTQSWEACRAAIFAKIENTPMGDSAALQDLHRYLKLITSARANLEQFMRQGKLAEIRLLEAEQARAGQNIHLFRP